MITHDPPFDTTEPTTVPTTDKTTTVETTPETVPTTVPTTTTTTVWTPKMGGDIFVINSNTKNKHLQFTWALGVEDPEIDELDAFKWPRDTKVEHSCSLTFRGVMYILGGSGERSNGSFFTDTHT